MIRDTLALRGQASFNLVKGLEGSTDLRMGQVTIVGLSPQGEASLYEKPDPHDVDLNGQDYPLTSQDDYLALLTQSLETDPSSLPTAWQRSVLWNGGFYLYRSGLCETLSDGIAMTQSYWHSGKLRQQWQTLQQAITDIG